MDFSICYLSIFLNDCLFVCFSASMLFFPTSQSRSGYLRGCLPAFVYDLVCLCNLPYDRLPICLSVLPPVCLSDRTPTCALFAIKLEENYYKTSQLLCFFFHCVSFVFLEQNINRSVKQNSSYMFGGIWPDQKAGMSSQRLSIGENHNSFEIISPK